MDSTAGTPPGSTADPEQLTEKFSWADYVVFVLSLVITAVVGLIAAFWKRKSSDSQELLVASRSMHWFPVSLSMIGSILNGIALIGGPAEVYYFGIVTQWAHLGYALVPFISAHLALPTFFTKEFTSAYEYLELRYNYLIRATGSFLFALSLLLFLAAVLYAPALAFSQVTSLNLYMSIVITGAICTVYTGLGGMRAVVWTDTLQMVILVIGMIVLAIVGTQKNGGVESVWQDALDGRRLTWREVSPDPRIRKTVWSFFGMWAIYIGNSFSNQMLIQRYLAVRGLREAQKAVYMMWAAGVFIVILILLVGVFMYSEFKTCDPFLAGKISKRDQIVPYYLMLTLGEYRGLPGIFTAAVFAAALSSVSSAVNSLAAMTLEDFIKPAYKTIKHTHLSEKAATRLAIFLSFFFGILTICLSFAAEHMTEVLIEAAPRIWSLVGGPLAGVFILGFFFPWVEAWGAFIGLWVSLLLGMWLGVGNILYAEPPAPMPPGLECPEATLPPPKNDTSPPGGDLQDWYQISYMWFGIFTIGVCLIVGNVVSGIKYLLVSRRSGSNRKVERELLFPCAEEFLCCCPGPIRYGCPCGQPYDEESDQPGGITALGYTGTSPDKYSSTKELEMKQQPGVTNGMINAAFENGSANGSVNGSVDGGIHPIQAQPT